jgi:2'-5' RNA ligase
MLYPFVEPGRLRADVRRRLAAVAARTPPFEYQLTGGASWPEATYVAVNPVAPFVALQGRLAEAFPAFPIYGTDPGFAFVPHVTIAEGPPTGHPAILDDPAWRSLPRVGRVASIEVIARRPGAPWRTIWRLPLGRMRA